MEAYGQVKGRKHPSHHNIPRPNNTFKRHELPELPVIGPNNRIKHPPRKMYTKPLPETKVCPRCNRELGIDNFTLYYGKPRSYCKECSAEYGRELRRKRKESS